VAPGENVRCGQVVAECGNSGNTSAPVPRMALPALSATGNGLPVGHPAPDLHNVKLLQAPAGIKATWQSLNGKVGFYRQALCP
jgi:hypothetical protein